MRKLVRRKKPPFRRLGIALTTLGLGMLACTMPQGNTGSSKSSKLTPPVAPPLALNFAEFQKTVQPFFAAHCYECHGPDDSESGVRLDLFNSDSDLAKGMPTFERALKMLTARKMPPKDEARPTENEYHTATAWIDAYTTKFYMSGPIDPGRVTLHRLNRAEYNNTIRDLLALDYNPADAFPVDDAGYGFDNNGDVLSIAPVLLEKYITAASTSLKKALFAEPVLPPPIKQFDGATAEGDFPKSDPKAVVAGRGGSGGRAPPNPVGRVFEYYGNVYTDYDFPVDGDYIFSFRGYGLQGNDGPAKASFYVDTQPVGKAPFSINTGIDNAKVVATDPVHVTAGKHRIYLSFRSNTTKEQYLAALDAKKAADAAAAAAKTADTTAAPVAATSGATAPVAATTAPAAAAPAASSPVAANDAAPKATDSTAVATAQPAASTPTPAGNSGAAALAAAVNNPAATAGSVVAAAGTGARGAAPAGSAGTVRNIPPGGRPPPPKSITGNATLAVIFFSVEGPEAPTPDRMPESYHRIMVAQPSATVTKAQAAEKIIRNFATRAFRRPATEEEVKSLMDLYASVDAPDRSLEDDMSVVLQAVLTNPNFLFRVEQDPQPGEPGNVHTLNEYELASRLSYFIWSSMPDDELFALAAKGQLRAHLDAQIERMLKSPKSQALVDNFAGQWLRLRQVQNVSPDPTLYPAFDPELRESMLKETQLFFSSIKDEDRNVLDFINANYSFVNERLAKFYGIPGITGDAFQRVTFPPDSPRGG